MKSKLPTSTSEFVNRTSIMVNVIAERCLESADTLTPEQQSWFVNHADRWVRWFHANNVKWRRKLESRGNAGRDHVYTFVKHWLAAYCLDPSATANAILLTPCKIV